MNDREKKYLDLMHAELDGQASPSEMVALQEHLLSNPEARKTHFELAKLADLLDRVEDVETPEDLHKRILAALPARSPSRETTSRSNPWRIRFPNLKYGYALAAGLLLGLVIGRVAFRSLSSLETRDFSGTMIARELTSRFVPVDRMKLDRTDLSGSVGLSRSGSNFAIEFDLDSSQPVDVEVGFGGTEVGLKGFNQQPKSGLFEAKEGRITFRSEGKYHSTILLANEKNTEIILELKFFVSGQLAHHGWLRLPRSG